MTLPFNPDMELLSNIVDTIVGADGRQISSDEIRDIFCIEEYISGNPVTRALIKEAMRKICIKKGIPIGASSRGYFLIKTQKQLFRYLDVLKGRMEGIQERCNLVSRAWMIHLESEMKGG